MASDRRIRRIERLLDDAEEAVSALEWDVVRDRAQAVLAFEPDNVDALDLLAAAERSLGGGAGSSSVQAHAIPTVSSSVVAAPGTYCDYADALLLRNSDGDRAKAISLVDESSAVAKEVGMKLLMDRVLSRREKLIA